MDTIKRFRKNKRLTQAEFAERINVGLGTVRNWEQGQRNPNAKQRKKLAEFFEITEAELFGGTSPVASEIQKIPVISWVQANRFADIEDPFPPGISDEMVHTVNKGANLFALRVKDDCMEPEFRDGDIIVIQPNVDMESEKYFIVRDSKNNEATFKQLKIYGRNVILHPLNPKYKDIELDHDERYEIIGKVVEKIKKYS